jgi:DNA polymerase II small subunit/DNA polymerase delta subunit B
MISSSCWQARTNFQERVGHIPDPGMIPLVDLSTQQATMLNFME